MGSPMKSHRLSRSLSLLAIALTRLVLRLWLAIQGLTRTFSLLAIAIALITLGSVRWLVIRPDPTPATHELWTFAEGHAKLYREQVEQWGITADLDITLLGMAALERRMMGGFLSDAPLAGLIEIERRMAARAFAGPEEAIGFTDLAPRLRDEGLLERINPASFGPWRVGEEIFGLPHDVHPVMLSYRVDICERFGVDIASINTWDDFEREMRKVMVDEDGDGEKDHYPIAFGLTHRDQLELLLLQSGGGLFDASGEPMLTSDANIRALVRLSDWIAGVDPIAADARWDTPGGQSQFISGRAVCAFMPDWQCNVWKRDMPQLAGKVRLIPLPAFEPGGRRTSVWGGTMLGIARDDPNQDALWALAKRFYLSAESARSLYETSDIITPIAEYWADPVYDVPDPYFAGQAKGRDYINLAGQIPPRHPSVFNDEALNLVSEVLSALVRERRGGLQDSDLLAASALELLRAAQAKLAVRMERLGTWREMEAR